MQKWFRPQWLADALQEKIQLSKAARLAPHQWKGEYVDPKRAPVAAA